MSIPFNKKYKLEKSENFDEFLKELGKLELDILRKKISQKLVITLKGKVVLQNLFTL